MTNYFVSNLTAKTSKDQCQKLEQSLKAINGVERVTLDPAKSQVSLAFTGAQEPTREVIAGAVSKAGFNLKQAQQQQR